MAWTARGRGDSGTDERTSESPSMRIIEAVAAARGADSTEIEPLYGLYDLEAIDELVQNSRGDVRLQLSVDGHRVEVGPDGSVDIS